MENLILWGIPFIGALSGLSCRLFKSYTVFLNLTFAMYLSVWSESAISKLFRVPSSAEPYKAAITMLFCAILAQVLLQKLLEQLNPEERDFAFPLRLLDKLGGGLFGFLSGMVVVNFALFLLCIMPIKTNFASIIDLPKTKETCCANLLSFTRLIDGLSFQSETRTQRVEALEERIRKADPPPPPEEEKKKGKKDAKGAEDAEETAPAVPTDTTKSTESTTEGETKSTEGEELSEDEVESDEDETDLGDSDKSGEDDESSEDKADSTEDDESNEDE